jgi:hypothetical protein
MTGFKAIFTTIGGLGEVEDRSSYVLAAESKEEAENEALKITPPHRTNFVKIVDDGLVVGRLGLSLNA